MEKPRSILDFHERRVAQENAAAGKIQRRPAPLRTDAVTRCSAAKEHATPPETPKSPQSVQPSSATRSLFQNYLRAFCQFEPPAHVDKDDKALLMTVQLDAGDLVLIHSVHANGWADGTVLSTGARGWLPTNYCETFDHPSMRHLLNAMTQFWDLLGVGQESNLSTFVRQDYVRPLIAGVRYLLEHADCLHRDAALVQRSAGLRRLRKGLLADLSTLVQIAKRLQEVINEPYAGEVIPILLDDMMARAFKVVTRAVGFVDMLAQQRESLELARPTTHGGPDVTTLGTTNVEGDVDEAQPARDLVDSAKHFSAIPSPLSESMRNSGSGRYVSDVKEEDDGTSGVAKPAKSAVSHRLSMIKSNDCHSTTLVSKQLAQAHDLCISHIGSFIGLYLQASRPASELVTTIERLVTACRVLLNLVDKVAAFEPPRRTTMKQARYKFQLRLDEFTIATKDVFLRSDLANDDVVMLPEHTSRLIDIGTNLIRAVGDCVVKTRKTIEQVGDFDLDKSHPRKEDVVEEQEHAPSGNGVREDIHENAPPPADIAKGRHVSLAMRVAKSPSIQRATTAITVHDFGKLSPSTTLDAAAPEVPSSTHAHQSLLVSPQHSNESVHNSMPVGHASKNSDLTITQSTNPDRQCSTGASIAGSTDTHPTSLRDSGFTAVSEGSTRATTPDQDKESNDRGPCLMDSIGSLASLRSAANTEDSNDAEAQLLQKSYANELTLNKEGQVTGGSLYALVEQLTVGDAAPDPQFVAAFFVTFRSFTTPRELAQALIHRYDYIGDSKAVGTPVRLRVYNVFKGWLEIYWNAEADKVALGDIRYFALHKLKPSLPQVGERLVELTRRIANSYHNGIVAGPLVSGVGKSAPAIGAQNEIDSNAPEPIVTKSQLNALRNAVAGNAASCSVVDFDPLEVARQMTILSASIFREIQPEELLSLEWNKKDSTKAQNVRNMCTLNTDVAHFVGDTILTPEDAKKRAVVIKHWSKVATRCLELSNYESLMAIMCSLNSSVVQRLKRTWEVVSKKTKARLAELNTVVDFSRNQASLRRRLEKPFAPCLPFLGIYLTDLTMVDAGNPKLRDLPGSTSESGETISVINFDKHMRMAKIVSHVQKFQVPYKLKEVPEMQDWMTMRLERMRDGHAQMVQFHRRSLIIEPKADLSEVPKMPDIRRVTEPAMLDRTAAEERPKTAGSLHPTVRTWKPHGPTFEFLLRTNFNFKSKPEIPPLPGHNEPE